MGRTTAIRSSNAVNTARTAAAATKLVLIIKDSLRARHVTQNPVYAHTTHGSCGRRLLSTYALDTISAVHYPSVERCSQPPRSRRRMTRISPGFETVVCYAYKMTHVSHQLLMTRELRDPASEEFEGAWSTDQLESR